jgi:hypothetical protein
MCTCTCEYAVVGSQPTTLNHLCVCTYIFVYAVSKPTLACTYRHVAFCLQPTKISILLRVHVNVRNMYILIRLCAPAVFLVQRNAKHIHHIPYCLGTRKMPPWCQQIRPCVRQARVTMCVCELSSVSMCIRRYIHLILLAREMMCVWALCQVYVVYIMVFDKSV